MDERKYEDALKRAKDLLDDMDKGDYFASKADIENIFPELQENKDERIRKELISLIKYTEGRRIGYEPRITQDDMIAWLEKQGEKSTIIDIDKMVMEYSQTKDDDFGLPVNCMLRAYRKGINDALSITLFKKDFGL